MDTHHHTTSASAPTSCAATALAFLDSVRELGVVCSGVAQGAVLVDVELPCNAAQAPRVSCELDNVPSAHGTIAMAQATEAAQQALAAFQQWLGIYAPISCDNQLVLRLTAGVLYSEGVTTEILQLVSGTGRLTMRGKRAVFDPSFISLLESFARMEGGTRVFQNYDHFETSHTVRAGKAASAIAYHALVFESKPKPSMEKWCEVFDGGLYADDVARILEGQHG